MLKVKSFTNVNFDNDLVKQDEEMNRFFSELAEKGVEEVEITYLPNSVIKVYYWL